MESFHKFINSCSGKMINSPFHNQMLQQSNPITCDNSQNTNMNQNSLNSQENSNNRNNSQSSK